MVVTVAGRVIRPGGAGGGVDRFAGGFGEGVAAAALDAGDAVGVDEDGGARLEHRLAGGGAAVAVAVVGDAGVGREHDRCEGLDVGGDGAGGDAKGSRPRGGLVGVVAEEARELGGIARGAVAGPAVEAGRVPGGGQPTGGGVGRQVGGDGAGDGSDAVGEVGHLTDRHRAGEGVGTRTGGALEEDGGPGRLGVDEQHHDEGPDDRRHDRDDHRHHPPPRSIGGRGEPSHRAHIQGARPPRLGAAPRPRSTRVR